MQNSSEKQRSLYLLMVAQLLVSFRGGMIAPIMGLFVRSQGFSMAQIGILGTASMLGWFVFEPLMGLIADKWNKRLMLAGAMLLTTVLYGLYPFAQGLWMFIIMEFVKTSVMSAYSIPVKALTAELLPTQDRGKAYGRLMTVISVGGIISPLIGGYISEVAGYNIPFYLASVVGLVCIVAALRIQYDETEQHQETNDQQDIRKLLTGSVLAIFSVRGLFFFNAGFIGNFLSIYLNESPSYQASESQIGAFYTITRVAGTASRSLLGELSDKIGNKLLIMSSLLGTGLSYVTLVYSGGIWLMYAIGAIYGVFEAAANTGMMLHLISVMPKGRRGLTMGLYSEAENVGGLISTPTVGYLYQNIGGDASVLMIAGALLLNAFYSYLVIKEPLKED